MKNTFGSSISVTLFGESHGEYIGAVLDGLAPGIPVKESFIELCLELRRPQEGISTTRVEPDEFKIVSGVFEGRTTGTPICILIPNTQQHSRDYSATRPLARPGHADFTAYEKYHGFEDYRGGGHFSGRVTAALVAAGAILRYALFAKGIDIISHIARLGGIDDTSFEALFRVGALDDTISSLRFKPFPVILRKPCEAMTEAIKKAAAEGDSVGGILETAIIGVPSGVGEPWFDSLESTIAHALFSVPGIKGVEFGAGFKAADMKGSECNDPFRIKIYPGHRETVTTTNNNGGINGGISNGMPIVFRCAVKPTPSIFKKQDTINFMEEENAEISLSGRHDPCIVHRARAVVESVAAIAIADALAQRYGTDWLYNKHADFITNEEDC